MILNLLIFLKKNLRHAKNHKFMGFVEIVCSTAVSVEISHFKVCLNQDTTQWFH